MEKSSAEERSRGERDKCFNGFFKNSFICEEAEYSHKPNKAVNDSCSDDPDKRVQVEASLFQHTFNDNIDRFI